MRLCLMCSGLVIRVPSENGNKNAQSSIKPLSRVSRGLSVITETSGSVRCPYPRACHMVLRGPLTTFISLSRAQRGRGMFAVAR